MSTNIRVDRVNQRQVPCGTNSLRYLGGDFRKAKRTFDELNVGVDTWDQPNCTYGLILSVWNSAQSQYVIKCEKGLS